jgi:hypothetical protein
VIEQPNRLPLAQYLHLVELAEDLDIRMARQISIESVQEDIKRQLESSIPASRTGADFRSYEDLKQEAEAISHILGTIRAEIRPVASQLTPGFVESLQEEYEDALHAVQGKLKLCERLDKEYRRSHEQEGEALAARKEALLEAYQQGVGLPSVADLGEEIRRLEEAEEEINQFRERSAEALAELAEGQLDREKAGEYWERALEQYDSPILRTRRDKHLAVLEALQYEPAGTYDDLLREARDLFERATRAPLESLFVPENDLKRAFEKCENVVQGLSNHPYPSTTGQEAARLMDRISAYNDRLWRARAIACLAQAEVDLASEDLYQASESLAGARQAYALIWDGELQPSDAEKLEAIQRKIEIKAEERTDVVIEQWRARAQAFLDDQDAMAALNCIYAARALAGDGEPGSELIQGLESLEDQALGVFSSDFNVEVGAALAGRALEFLSQGDKRSAFRWLEAALRLDASAILSEPGFSELTDVYFELQSKRRQIEGVLIQADFRLAQDLRDRDNVLAVEGLLAEAEQLLKEVGETGRLPEVEEKRNALQQRHRQALTQELNGLLQELDDACRVQEPSPQQRTAALSVLNDLSHVLANIEEAGFKVKGVKPHLERACEYYAQLQAEAELEGDLNCAVGHRMSHLLLSKVSAWEAG